MTRFIPKIVSIKGSRRNFFSSPLHFPRLARFESPLAQNIATMDPHSEIGAAVNYLAPGIPVPRVTGSITRQYLLMPRQPFLSSEQGKDLLSVSKISSAL